MCSPAPSRPRPLSITTRPPAPEEPLVSRKHSLDHGGWKTPPPVAPPQPEPAQVTVMESGGRSGTSVTTKEDPPPKALSRQASIDSISCEDNYLLDFFDRNCRPATPAVSVSDVEAPGSGVGQEQVNESGVERVCAASANVKQNVNGVRPRSWLTTPSGRVDDIRRVRRRQTDPCGKDFLSNYERALSSLLYQPYECRSEGPSTSTSTFDRGRSSVGECCSYRSSDSSSSSVSTLSGSLAGYTERKPWGDSKDPSSSSIRALLTGASDLEASLPREPLGALPTGCRSQSGPGDGREMVVSETSAEDEASYRAVPATVSSVPVIPCNNNVRIVQTARTFTSTEAQTDDVIVDAIRVPPGPSGVNPNREQRRRERRERRHQRRLVNHLHQTPDPAMWQSPIGEPMVDRLPDILNSHLPPPYTTIPLGLAPPPLPPPLAVGGSSPSQPGGIRFPFAIVPAGRRRTPHFTAEDEPKSCCGVAVSQTVSIRWFIVLIFVVGMCCAVVGTVLGAMKASGRDHLTLSLLMIGVGIVLVAVSAVAWRLTSQDAPSCRAMLGLGGDDSNGEPNRRFVPRLPPSYGRPHHPYAAMMYPEFQYRAPPPSYQASMQEYRLRLLLLDRHSGAGPGTAVSPPPTYRSQPSSLLRAPIGFRGRETLTPSQSEYSRPPSYRSRTSSRPDPPSSHSHSREPSGSEAGQAVNVITVHPQHIIKLAPSPPLPAKNGKEHLVTIVQTTSEPSGPVIVTISGQQDHPSTTRCPDSEMEILAHL